MQKNKFARCLFLKKKYLILGNNNILMKKLFLLLLLASPNFVDAQIITTFAGNGTAGFTGDGGLATAANINYSRDVAADATGNIYFSDCNNNRIRKVSPTGVITTIAGTGTAGFSGDGGPATAAKLNCPYGLAFDDAGNMYIADYNNNRVRKINTSGIISTFAGNGTPAFGGDGGAATLAQLWIPNYICADHFGNVYIVDNQNQRIRKVNASGIISTYAGTGSASYGGDGGPATLAQLNYPGGIKMDSLGNMYIADGYNSLIRKISPAGIITSIGGNGSTGFSGDGGPATLASINIPIALCLDNVGNIYFSDGSDSRVRKISTTGLISTITGTGTSGYSGDGGPATAAEVNFPDGLCFDNAGSLYIAEYTNFRVRKIIFANHPPTFTAGHIINTTICENTIAYSLNAMLVVNDIDISQTETWSTAMAPHHGTLAVTYTATSTGGTLTPTGLYYTPTTGFSGNDTFSVRVNDGFASDTTKIYVNVSPLPTVGSIAGLDSICLESINNYSNASTGGTWSISNASASISDSGLVMCNFKGTDTITYTVANACGTASATKIIHILDSPIIPAIAGPTFVCVGSSISLSDSLIGGTWSNTTFNTSISGACNVNGINPGFDTITYLVTNMCGTSIALKSIEVYGSSYCDSLLDAKNIISKESSYTIFPNPTNNTRLNIAKLDNANIGNIQLINQLGQILFESNIEKSSAQLNLEGLPKGIYILKLGSGEKVAYQKIINN